MNFNIEEAVRAAFIRLCEDGGKPLTAEQTSTLLQIGGPYLTQFNQMARLLIESQPPEARMDAAFVDTIVTSVAETLDPLVPGGIAFRFKMWAKMLRENPQHQIDRWASPSKGD